MDTCTVLPELKWSNDGFVGGANKKKLPCDDMSTPQWVAGQLNNISQIQGNNLLRFVLHLVIAAMLPRYHGLQYFGDQVSYILEPGIK